MEPTAVVSPLQKALRQLGKTLIKHSPSILTGVAVAGVVTTVILAVKATPRATEILEDIRQESLEKNEKADPIRIAEELTPVVAPAAIMGTLTITAIILANRISLRRQAALAGLFSVAEASLREYQNKVVDRIGRAKEDQVRGDVARDALSSTPLIEDNIIRTEHGSDLCFDRFSGRYFYGNIETIRQAQNTFNKELLTDMEKTLNEFYADLGLPGIEIGEYVGWRMEGGMMDVQYSATIAKETQAPCIVMFHKKLPEYLR